MSRAVMQQAMDWISSSGKVVFAGGGMSAVDAMNRVHAALRAELAKPESTKVNSDLLKALRNIATSTPESTVRGLQQLATCAIAKATGANTDDESQRIAADLEANHNKSAKFHASNDAAALKAQIQHNPDQRDCE